MLVKLIVAAVLVAGLGVFLFEVQDVFAARRAGETIETSQWAKIAAAGLVNTICGWLLIRQSDGSVKKRQLAAQRRAADLKARRTAAVASNLDNLQE